MNILSELEGVVVGIILKRQTCTAYAVRKELKASPSTHWRASAGAIYPLLERLEKEKVIAALADNTDGRGRKLLSITSKGKKALSNWIKDFNRSDKAAAVYDPLRTRIFFLDVLGEEERTAFLLETHRTMQAYLAGTAEHLQKRSDKTDLFEYLGALGGTMDAQNRLEYVDRILEELVGPKEP